MTVTVQVLFGRPQREIASLLRDRLSRCTSASLVAGFMTVEGIAAIAGPLRAAPSKLAALVVGAGTWRAFAALDGLIAAGVSPDALYVHLGHSRATRPGAIHSFYRYHPMLHSKVYLMEMDNGTAAAFVGSHNLTGFALLGLNGEAGILLEGKSDEPEFIALKQHVAEAVSQAERYDPSMKEAYSWWTSQFIEGLGDKARDIPRDSEGKRTIVVIAVHAAKSLPQEGDVIYFEIPEALGQSISSLRAEVHIYLFHKLPISPAHALAQLVSANKSLWCKIEGLELGSGGQELLANWFIDNRRQPDLKPAPVPFRPASAPGMQQVRVRVSGHVFGKFEYLFDSGYSKWMPLFDEGSELGVVEDDRTMLAALTLVPAEDLPWHRVRGLVPADAPPEGEFQLALRESTPDSGSFILFSLRRRNLSKANAKEGRSIRGTIVATGAGLPNDGPSVETLSAGEGAQATDSDETLVEHITKRGKRLRGVVRATLTEAQAREIDPGTFKKDGGWFIRAERLK